MDCKMAVEFKDEKSGLLRKTTNCRSCYRRVSHAGAAIRSTLTELDIAADLQAVKKRRNA